MLWGVKVITDIKKNVATITVENVIQNMYQENDVIIPTITNSNITNSVL